MLGYVLLPIHRVANSVYNGLDQTLRSVEARPDGPRAGRRFLGRGSEPPPHQLGV